MYTFEDKAERSMTLRPEGTAPVMRSFVENQLHQFPADLKLFYIGPMFRYERPQAGRYRQHHQFGVEAIGIGKPEQDVEMIDLVCELYRTAGIRSVEIGSLMFGHAKDGHFEPAPMELVRLAMPRRVYTQSHIDFVIEVFADIAGRARSLRGLRLLASPPRLAHFTAKLAPEPV